MGKPFSVSRKTLPGVSHFGNQHPLGTALQAPLPSIFTQFQIFSTQLNNPINSGYWRAPNQHDSLACWLLGGLLWLQLCLDRCALAALLLAKRISTHPFNRLRNT